MRHRWETLPRWTGPVARGLPPLLHHDASPRAFEGIVCSHALRATLLLMLDDSSETAEAESVLRRLMHDHGEHPADLGRFGSIRRNFSDCDYFVSCFTSVADEQSMWRSYGHAGYRLAFEREHLDAAVDPQRSKLFEVSDDRDAFARHAATELERYRTLPEGATGTDVNPTLLLAGLKHPEWRSEQEWRLIALRHVHCGGPVQRPDVRANDLDSEEEDPVRFDDHGSGPRAYVDLAIRDPTCLRAVIVSPGAGAEDRAYRAEFLLRSSGLSHVEVHLSGSSLRP